MNRSTKRSTVVLVVLTLILLKLLSPSVDLGAIMTSVSKVVEALDIVKESSP